MTKKEARDLLGLHEQATRDEITRRYDVLVRKLRDNPEGQAAQTMEQVEEAYKILTGIAWKDPEAEKRLRERDAHPGILARLLKMEQTKLDNLVHYYTKPAIAVLLALALVVWIIVSTVFRPKEDFRLLAAGDIYIAETERVEAAIKTLLPGTTNPMVQSIYLNADTDASMEYTLQQKLMVEIGYGEQDIMLVDRDIFTSFAEQGAFAPLDDVLAEYGTTAEEQKAQSVVIPEDNRAEGDDGGAHIYGISVTDSRLLAELEILGGDIIAVFGHKSEFPDKGQAVMRALTEP